MDAYLLGMDIGTSVVKVGLFDANGREWAVASRRMATLTPKLGWSEAEMNNVWEAVAIAIRELLATAEATGDQIAAIGLTGNMIGAWLIDADGQPVRTAILWNDGRTTDMIKQLSEERPAFMSTIFQSSASVMQQGCTLPLVRWLAENDPQALERARAVLCCKDWIRFRLTGALHTDPTEASVLPGDIHRRDYSPAMFAWLGIEDHRHLFPPVHPSEGVAGVVSAEAAAQTGLRPGTPVVTGAGDVPASALGAGAVDPGIACTILGTTCLNCLVVERPMLTPPDIGLTFCLPRAGWLRVMANIAGTTNLDWFIENFYAAERAQAATGGVLFARLEADLTASPPGASGVIYHPYLSQAGVIAPFFEPGARAQFFGLSNEHRRADLLRAIYEGTALAIRDCYAAMGVPLNEIRISGGGAKSPVWTQMIADCTGARVVVPEGREFGARGAALLAGIGAGWFDDLPAASRAIGLVRAQEPQPELVVLYDDVYRRYRAIREALLPVWAS
ncbi:MAG: FGGY-family carbohydrate kinase [Aggregatilineales bacterium]